MNKISAILLAFSLICEAENYTAFVEQWEGCKLSVYKDTDGNRIIGVGLNIDDASAQAKLKGFGIKVADLIHGQSISLSLAQKLHRQEVACALVTAKEVFPSFDKHPEIVRQILVDMTFALGPNKILGFVDFKAAIERKDYKTASAEIVDSVWYIKTKRRGKHHAEKMLNAGLK